MGCFFFVFLRGGWVYMVVVLWSKGCASFEGKFVYFFLGGGLCPTDQEENLLAMPYLICTLGDDDGKLKLYTAPARNKQGRLTSAVPPSSNLTKLVLFSFSPHYLFTATTAPLFSTTTRRRRRRCCCSQQFIHAPLSFFFRFPSHLNQKLHLHRIEGKKTG